MTKRLILAVGFSLIAMATGILAYDRAADAQEIVPVTKVDHIVIDKSDHQMAVYQGGILVRTFKVALGRGGLAPKERQGDNRVPEGDYRIVGRNPDSAFHLSLKIGYPTPDQAKAARSRGIDPGDDIMIHGLPNGSGWLGPSHRRFDWTRGCAAVTDEEMDWIYRSVADGTPVDIRA